MVIKATWRTNFAIYQLKVIKGNVKFHVNTPFLAYHKPNSNNLGQNFFFKYKTLFDIILKIQLTFF